MFLEVEIEFERRQITNATEDKLGIGRVYVELFNQEFWGDFDGMQIDYW